MQHCPTHGFSKEFRKYRLTFSPLLSRLSLPAICTFKERTLRNQDPMNTRLSASTDHPSDAELAAKLDLDLLPKHVAIIMDGNGRWAEARSLPRIAGHREGIKSVREMITICLELGIQALTIYAFSQENWNRPAQEINALMGLLEHYLSTERNKLIEQGVRFRTIGRTESLPASALQWVRAAEQETAHLNKLHLTVALSYGGRAEIVDAVRGIVRETQEGKIQFEDIDESLVHQFLYAHDLSDPDLLIRTSGETRISNFLLWQLAYTELYFTPTLWPDFRRRELLLALIEYQRRERRFGRVFSSVSS
jgi:undecaprenyl diphosphate synthase